MPSKTEDLNLALSHLEAEGAYLDEIVTQDGVSFSEPTPSKGWTIGHQIGHLLWTDRVSILACRDPAGFARQAEAFGADPEKTINAGAGLEAGRPTGELIEAWREGRADLLTALSGLPAGSRVPWFGPTMGVASMAATRIMETWAHGLDITDALGLDPVPTARLHHIAEMGVQTRDFTFSIHGRRSPWSAFRVELAAPDGGTWTWGPATAADRITGSALDFCMLVAQRRHRDDLALVATEGMADQWLDIAQVFAGPAGPGRSARVSS
ncbi:TIGR03084 family metal-binding protein [Nakamurella sp. PAMC28650]|uniref:TIGR03084 family metal-binding protein n=1 Tax=Nakamurella sp. PAMC28650 TaxID=2762325 RepID=UPI00164EBF2D|nr:TIGR03084 family metal-binding protein [Nakamurella sp. PAMC28650]QNK83382.1 TIGR03084 family protein [Nakamurella sp. PAMC28650]